MRKCFSEIYRGYIRSVKNVTNQSTRAFERPVSSSTILYVFPLVTEEYTLSIILSIFWATSTLHNNKLWSCNCNFLSFKATPNFNKKETGLWEIPAYSEVGSACIPLTKYTCTNKHMS